MMKRRRFLQSAALLAAGTGIARAETVPFSAGEERPHLHAPAKAIDCHMHIYDRRFPAASNAVLVPPEAKVEDYRRLQHRLGITRNVVVQPSTYGTDNRCTLDALAQFWPLARAVAVVDTSVSDAELRRLDGLGVRGIRFNLIQAGATTLDMVEPLSRRVEPLGWHVQLHMTGAQIADAGELLVRLPARLVFDHLAHIPFTDFANAPSFAVVRRLLDEGRTWIKLSGAYQDSRVGPPDYRDATPLAQALVQLAPDRMVWASDWPHPTEKITKPDDAVLFDLLEQWVPDAATRHRILVETPEMLYGFPSSE
ncbi:MAG TPA: amidohydrolase family protein [Stellaceae bacterium]|nr:amidohydrolase family protein [Stellaceae bacterium]